MSEAPKTIWLQRPLVDDDEASNEDITWCADYINDDDTEYVRADEIERNRAAIAELLGALESVMKYVRFASGTVALGFYQIGIDAARAAIAKHTGEE